MTVIKIVILAFCVLGALDWLAGNRLGFGKEFERGFSLFGAMALSMLGMLVLAPLLGVWLTPAFLAFYRLLGIDPSIIPASLFANDMGGTVLSQSVAVSEEIGNYNAFIVSSMMGCVISFTIPFSLGLVPKERHRELFFGLLCGIVTIPAGCLVAGLFCNVRFTLILINLIPLLIISVLLVLALCYFPTACIKCFSVFGTVIKVMSLVGLLLALFTFLTGLTVSPHLGSFEEAALVCANACVTLSGALPLMLLLSRLLARPLGALGRRMGINSISALSFLASLVTNASSFGVARQMDRRGLVLNAAFAVSASFAFGSHLAFTMAFSATYVLPMILGKVVAGVLAVILAMLLYREKEEPTAA